MAATIGKAEGTEAILDYIKAYKGIETENANITAIETQEQQMVVAMVGDQPLKSSEALSGINKQLLAQATQGIERYNAIINENAPKVNQYFNDIRATQTQQQYIGYILVPDEGKKIFSDTNDVITVANI